jgi:uncharacterized protein YndB with AHSA1/START domain
MIGAPLTRRIAAPPAAVWEVLADGRLYATWVVGASRIRGVDPEWPAPGSRIAHSFGVWPLVIDDVTEALECEPERRLVLRAHGWPAGAARVEITLTPAGDGTEVTLREDAEAGPGRLVPKPARQLAILPRNTESLRRLAYLAEGRPGRAG